MSDISSNKDYGIKNYNLMEEAIFGKEMEYQYFKGAAFYHPEKTRKITPAIRKEVDYARRISKNGVIYKEDKHFYYKDLNRILDERINEYEKREIGIFNELKTMLIKEQRKKMRDNTWTDSSIESLSLEIGSSVMKKIEIWDRLFNYGLYDKFNANEANKAIDLSNDPDNALYVFLMSKQLYDSIRRISPIRTMISREKWEDAYLGEDSNLYGTDANNQREIIEKQMWEALTDKNGNLGSIIYQGFSKALDGLNLGTGKSHYLSIVSGSFGAFKKKMSKYPADYTIFHDEIKKWGAQLFKRINDELEAQAKRQKKKKKQLEQVKIGNNGIYFFTIRGDKYSEIEKRADLLDSGLSNAILSFIQSMKKDKKNFKLSVHPYSMRTFTLGTATAAEKKANAFISGATVHQAIRNYLTRNEENTKSNNSNSIISGVLGEIASILKLESFGIVGQMTGEMQQYYNTEKEQGRTGFGPGQDGWKSSGAFFSDITARAMKYSFGINVKRYITNKNIFTLVKAQKEGLNLRDVQLRRYLSLEEINLLKFVQANMKLLGETSQYLNFNDDKYNLNTIATNIMNKNISSVLRITGAGFDITNYIIAANGHYIPASCVFQYAKKLLIKDQKKLYDVLNDNPINYVDIGDHYAAGKNNKINLDTNNLMIDQVIKKKESLAYRFYEFKVSISDLLKL